MINLRDLAKGQDCQIRLPGCQNATETVVLAHCRMPGTCGVGQKPPDECGAWACFHCHQIVDGRSPRPPGMTFAEVDYYFAEGVMRTLHKLSQLGYKMKKC